MEGKKTLSIALSGHLISDQRMQRIAGALQEAGWNVELHYRHFFKYKHVENPTEYPYPVFPVRTPFRGGMAFYACFNLILFFRLLFRKTSVLYAVDSDTLPALTLLSLLKQKPLVYDAHEYFAEVPELQQKPIRKRIWHFITRLGVRRAGLCFTVGPRLASELSRVYGKPFISLRNVPEPLITETAAAADPPLIIYQGALNKGRMLELLIRTMPSLPEFTCILAGEGDLSQELRLLAGKAKNIEFAGLLSPSALRELTPRCFAGYNLLDGNESLSYYYSLSNKYFDYMQAGIPSLSSALPEYLELNARWECGVCIEHTPEALSEVLRIWKNNPALYAKLKENAKFAAAGNHWQLEKEQLLSRLRP